MTNFTLLSNNVFFNNINSKDDINNIYDDILSSLTLSLLNDKIFKFRFVEGDDVVCVHIFGNDKRKEFVERIKEHYIEIEKYEIIDSLNEMINVIDKLENDDE